jgi:excisionase family DNA binding protein
MESVVQFRAADFLCLLKLLERIARWMMQETTRDSVEPLLLTVSQTAKMLSLGRTKVYELIATEGLPVVHFGRAKRVSMASLQRWLESREQKAMSA